MTVQVKPMNPQEVINNLPNNIRKGVDELYYQYCIELSPEVAREELQLAIDTLQHLLDNSKF